MSDLPPVRLAHNLKLVGHDDLGGAPNAGEGIAIKITRDGRRIMYLAHENPPMCLSVLDVSTPSAPTLLWQLPLPHNKVRGNSLAMHGDLLLQAYQVAKPGDAPAGFEVYDISTPDKPRKIGWFDASGPHSQGVHYICFNDGRYAHISTGAADFEPNHPNDHQFYMVVDMADPTAPREVGRWWLPGQRKGDDGRLPARHPAPYDIGFRPHHTMSFAERPDRVYIGYIDGGVVILDIADLGAPKLVAQYDYHPPYPGFTHTCLPLFDRGFMLVTDEATGDEGIDWPKRMWMMDIRSEAQPIIVSSMPTPAGFEDLHRVGGRIGAHNIHENEPHEAAAKLVNTVAATWFSAGLRIYDIRDPYRFEEIAAFLPETPKGQRGCRISDVYVDDRGIVFTTDRARGGLYVLEYTGAQPLN
ncbi:MAG: hypothetical protein H6983_20870 [Ectothiorhodospiraceae bacterium]|nr:hypothetical protein [Ectothiorhodospiraceae bacterium]